MSTTTSNINCNGNGNGNSSNFHYTDEELYLDSTSLQMLNNNPNPSSNSHAAVGGDAYYHLSTTSAAAADGRMMMSTCNSEHHYHPDNDGMSSMATFSCRESTINTFSTTLSAMDLGLMDEMIMGSAGSVPTMPTTMADNNNNDPHDRFHGRYIPPPTTTTTLTRHSPTHQPSWYADTTAPAPSPVPVSPSPSPLLYGGGGDGVAVVAGGVRGRHSITDSDRTVETVNLSAVNTSQPNMFLQPQQHVQQQQRGPYQPQTLQQQQQQQQLYSTRVGLESPFPTQPPLPTPPTPPRAPAGYPRTVSGHHHQSSPPQQPLPPQQAAGPDLLTVVDQLQRELRHLRLQVQQQQQQQQQHQQHPQPSSLATLPPHHRARRMTEPSAMPFFSSASLNNNNNININNKDTTLLVHPSRSSPSPHPLQQMPTLPKLAAGTTPPSKTSTSTTSSNKFLQDYHIILGERTKTTILTDLYKNYLRNIFPKSDKFQLHDLYQLLTVGYKCHVGSDIPPGERVCFWVRHDPTDGAASAAAALATGEIRYDKNDNAAFCLATDDKIKKDVKENRTSSARPGRERKRKTNQKASGKRTRRGDDDEDDDDHHHHHSDNSGPGTGGNNNNNSSSRGPTGNSGGGGDAGSRSGTGEGNNNNQTSYGGGSSQGRQRGNRPVDQVEHVEHEYVCCTSEEDGSSDHDLDDDDDESSYYDSDHDIQVGSPTVGGEWVFPEESSSSSRGGNTKDQLRRDSHFSYEKPQVPNSKSHDVLLDSHKAISAKVKTDGLPAKKKAPYSGPPVIQKEAQTHTTLGSDLGPTKPAYFKPANAAAGKTEDMNHHEDYFWFFLGDDGDWYPFDDRVVERLEATRRSGKLTVECRVGENDYSLNVHRLEQTNVRSGNFRPIAKATAHWWWRDEDKVWQAYNRQDALKLALADLSAVEKSVYLRHGETVYFADLEKRVQRNVETNYERDIHQGLLGGDHKTSHDNNKASDNATPVASKGYESDDSLQVFLPLAHPSYICPLSKKVMRNPVLTAAGSTYEYKQIAKYLKNHNDDPLTKRPLPSKALTENRGIRDTIGQWRDDMLAQKRYERPSDTTIEKFASVSSGWDSRRPTQRPGQ